MADEKKDLWIKEEENNYRIGLTDKSLDDLGTVKFLSLSSVGDRLEKDQPFAEVEAEKAVTEFTAPITGEVIAVNKEALKNPELLNAGEETAWLVEMSK